MPKTCLWSFCLSFSDIYNHMSVKCGLAWLQYIELRTVLVGDHLTIFSFIRNLKYSVCAFVKSLGVTFVIFVLSTLFHSAHRNTPCSSFWCWCYIKLLLYSLVTKHTHRCNNSLFWISFRLTSNEFYYFPEKWLQMKNVEKYINLEFLSFFHLFFTIRRYPFYHITLII